MRCQTLIAVSAAIACGLGCSPEVAAAGCDENIDCADGEVCVAGSCRTLGGGGEGEGEGEGEGGPELVLGARSGQQTASGGGFTLRFGPAGNDVPVTVTGSRFTLRPQAGRAR